MLRNGLPLSTLIAGFMISTASAIAGVNHVDNFENYPIGDLPVPWIHAGDGVLAVENGMNHTGIQPPWRTPDFGPEGDQSLALSLTPGEQSAIILFDMPSGITQQGTVDFSMKHDAGLVGTLQIDLFGDGDGLIISYFFDLTTGEGVSTMVGDDGVTVTTELNNPPGGWTEHMLGLTLSSGPRVCGQCETQTYWSRAPAPPQNFIRMEFSVNTTPDSAGGNFYIDDVALTDCAVDLVDDGLLDIFDVFAFIEAYNAGSLGVDYIGDDLLDIFDVFAFVEAFNTGCP